MKNKLIAVAALLAISSQMKVMSAGTTTTTSTKTTSTKIDTGDKSRTTIDRTSSTKPTHQIRTRTQVQQHRSAHSKARLDHTINKGMMIMRSPVTTVNVGRQAKIDASGSAAGGQHFVITAGHDDKDSDSGSNKSSGGQSVASKSGSAADDRSGTRGNDKFGSLANDKSGSHADGKIAQKASADRETRKAERENQRAERRLARESRRAEKRGNFLSHFHHGKKNDGQDSGAGSEAPGSGNQGIGDGSNVSLNGGPNIDELNDKTNLVKTINLREGDAFVAHNRPVHINTSRGQVRIAPHSAVYVVSEGKSVAIYNIADNTNKDVIVITSGKKSIPVKAGEQVVLAGKENKEFDKANPVPEIHAQRTKELGEDLQNRIFNAEFSPISALDHAKGFQDLVNSKNKEDQKLADHILKMAAIVLSLRGSSSD